MPLPPVNANVPNPVPLQPAIRPGGVEPPPNAPAPNEPPQEAPAGVPGGDAAAKELVRSLDVLLARAGKAAGRTVDEAAIAKLAKGAKFDKATVDSLRATAKAANEAMRVLDSFTGEDFANAMDVNQETGVVDWNRYSYVGKSVQAALDKQQALKEGRDREALLKDWADRLGGPRSQQYLNAKTRLDEAIACAERLEQEGKVYRAEDWESDAVQKRILEAELPQDLTLEFSQNPVGGTIVQAPTGNAGRTLVADYQYMMAGSLYVRDFGKWE